MATTENAFELPPSRPRRADALRNHERLIAAAREAFAEGGVATSLEEIARRAGVVRSDASFDDAMQIVMGITKASGAEAERTERILDLALDGLRHQGPRGH